MIIDVSQIKKCDGAAINIDCNIEYGIINFNKTDIELLTPVSVKGSIKNHDDVLYLKADAKTEILVECARCLEKVKKDFSFCIDYQFSNVTSGEDIIPFESDEIDLKYITEQQFCTSLPIAFLCKEDCKGLCLKCGQNLNVSSCNCEDDDIDPRLAVLKKFR